MQLVYSTQRREIICSALCLCILSLIYQSTVNASSLFNTNVTYDLPAKTHLGIILNSLYELQSRHWLHERIHHAAKSEVVVVFQQELWQLAAGFQQTVSRLQSATSFIEVHTDRDDYNATMLLQILRDHHEHINTVALFLNDDTWILQLTKTVCSEIGFKWTHLLHTAEWVAVTESSNLLEDFKTRSPCIDFFTVIVQSQHGLKMARKSRGQHASSLEDHKPIDASASIDTLRTVFRDLRGVRKSVLEGLHMPVALLEDSLKYTEKSQVGNVTQYTGYGIALVEILASYFGFTFSYIMPPEGETYGSHKGNGVATGITGLLARREAAFSCMDISKTDNRREVIDYIDYPTSQDPHQIIYKLPDKNSRLDTTLLGIVHSRYYPVLLGPLLLMLLIGGITHVSTKSCVEAKPRFSKQYLSRLWSFPDHICFHSKREYAGQTGRILRASWGVFWVVFSAAYSAHLVTKFTVSSPELKMDRFEDLLQHSNEFRFGTITTNSAFMFFLQTTTDPEVQEIWRRMLEFNRTDPWTVIANMTEHFTHVLEGSFATIGQSQRGDIPMLIENPDLTNVRGYTVHSLDFLSDGFIALPKDAFYKKDFNAAVLRMEASGALSYLRNKYIIRPMTLPDSPIEEENRVSLSRVLLLLYVVIAGIGLALTVLALEVLYVRSKTWLINSLEDTAFG